MKYRDDPKTYEHEWYLRNQEKVKTRAREYYRAHRDRHLANMRKWRKRNPEKNRYLMWRWGRADRKSIVESLGGKCVRCGFSDFRALQIDHLNGHGRQQRKKYPGPSQFYQYVRKHPAEFQILCANCNFIKRAEREEIAHPVGDRK